MLATNTLAQLWLTGISNSGDSSSGSSSSSRAVRPAAAQPQLLQQLAAAVPCREASLLLLEAVLLQLYTQDPDSDLVTMMNNVRRLLIGLFEILEHRNGAAASAEAASVLLQAVVQLMPQAVLHAAAAAGCESLRPNADKHTSDLAQALHDQYAKLAVSLPVFAAARE
jgi:hypothetical protein